MKRLLPKSINNPKGFTLVELLVVVSIIAILSVIGVTVFTGVQKGARDARRRGDIQAISKAYEVVYTAVTPRYRVLGPNDFSGGIVPVDPQTGVGYAGILATAADTYTVCASMENANGNSSTNTGNAATGTAATFYCQKNQQ